MDVANNFFFRVSMRPLLQRWPAVTPAAPCVAQLLQKTAVETGPEVTLGVDLPASEPLRESIASSTCKQPRPRPQVVIKLLIPKRNLQHQWRRPASKSTRVGRCNTLRRRAHSWWRPYFCFLTPSIGHGYYGTRTLTMPNFPLHIRNSSSFKKAGSVMFWFFISARAPTFCGDRMCVLFFFSRSFLPTLLDPYLPGL